MLPISLSGKVLSEYYNQCIIGRKYNSESIFGSYRVFACILFTHCSVKSALSKCFQSPTFKIFIFLFQELLNVFYTCVEIKGHISSTLDFSVLAKILKIKLINKKTHLNFHDHFYGIF